MTMSNLKKRIKKRIETARAKSQTVRKNEDTRKGIVVDEVHDYIPEINLTKPGAGDEGPSVVCECGWSYGPSSNMLDLGRQAFSHSEETGHRLRKHDR